MARLSTPGMGVPMMVNSDGSFSFTEARSGGGTLAASLASEPYPRERPVFLWCTLPLAVVHSEAGTFHVWAAAVTSMARPAAPTWRKGSQFIGTALLPPAHWSW